MGPVVVNRGEIWWGEIPDEKGRPFLVVSRDVANVVMQRVVVAPITRHIRGIPSEIAVGQDEGLPVESAASFDNIRPFPRALLVRRLGSLGYRQHEICRALAAMADC